MTVIKNTQKNPALVEDTLTEAAIDEDLKLLGGEEVAPVDRFNLVYLIMVLQGAGTLFPWNAFISAPDYFEGKYGKNTLLYFQIAYSIPNIISMAALVKFTDKIPLMIKAIPTYVVCLLILLSIPIMGFANVSKEVGFPLTVSLLVVMALVGSTLQGGVFGMAGVFPPRYMQAVMLGNGVAGLTVILIRVITKATIEANGSTDHTKLISSAIYFFVSSGVIVVCIISYIALLRFEFVKYYLNKASKPSDVTQYDEYVNTNSGEVNQVSIIAVFKKIWKMALCVFFIFTISLAVFPGLSVTIPSAYSNAEWASWFPVIMILMFQLFDFVGRFIPRFIILFNQSTIIPATIMRIIFVVLFLLCLKPRVITPDVFPLLFMVFMALTNGYFSSIIMMLAPSNVEDYEKQTASTMMTFFLLLGICAGSNVGLILGLLIENF